MNESTLPLLNEADRCVKCGLCLPHCPTYLKLTDEADSPRGRIALIQAWAAGELEPSAGLARHLDRCLGCRACERVCPSGVRFGRLLDGARAGLRQDPKGQGRGLPRWLLGCLSDRGCLRRLARPLPLLRASGLLALGKRLTGGRLRRLLMLAELLPPRPTRSGLYPARQPTGRRLQLFIGCISSQADRPAIQASLELLQGLGYAVDIPAGQVCCGALYRHNGLPEEADELCERNRQLTRRRPAAALITLASACQLELTEQQASSLPVHDIIDFLLELAQQGRFELAPLNARVAIHTPCTAGGDRSARLLRLIPGVEPFELPDNAICCGAAGSYLLSQPTLSRALGRDKRALIEAARPNILVTGNTGCALQLRLQIAAAGLAVELLHPVELFQRQFRSFTLD